MCLYHIKREEKEFVIAWKVVVVNNGRWETCYGFKHGGRGCKDVIFEKYQETDYGFHAFKTRREARREVRCWQEAITEDRADKRIFRICKVRLSGIIYKGISHRHLRSYRGTICEFLEEPPKGE